MTHSHPASTPSESTRPAIGRGPRDVMPSGEEARAIGLQAMRELRSPLAALRVLLEGQRAGGAGKEFSERAIEEIDRAEEAANDLLAWTLPRSLRTTHGTLGEMIQCLRESLSPADRRRTHFVVENEATNLQVDARLLVTGFSRSLRHAYRDAGAQPLEVMVHAHASEGIATFSFIYSELNTKAAPSGQGTASLADALLALTVDRIDGRLTVHDAEGHRCAVVTLPTSPKEGNQ